MKTNDMDYIKKTDFPFSFNCVKKSLRMGHKKKVFKAKLYKQSKDNTRRRSMMRNQEQNVFK